MNAQRSSETHYIQGIDGLRALAVLAVIIYHLNTAFLPGGFTGVDVFFVISGYVVSKSLARRLSPNFFTYVADFYKRRIIRIIPPLWVCLIVFSLISTLFIPSARVSETNDQTALAAFFGLSNFALIWFHDGYFSPEAEFNPFLHTWSLGVEEQFYVLFPAIFFIWLAFKNEQSLLGGLSRNLLPGLAILSLIQAYAQTTSDPNSAFYLLPSRFWEMASGGVLFTLQTKNIGFSKSTRQSSLLLLLGTVLLGISFLYSDRQSFPFPWAILSVVGTILLLIGLTSIDPAQQKRSPIHRLLEAKVVTYLGKISYSLYLWHWPVFVLFKWTVGLEQMGQMTTAVILSFLLSIASYHFIESPIRRNQYLKLQKSWKIISMGLVTTCALFLLAAGIFKSHSLISLSVTKDRFNWYPYENASSVAPDIDADSSLAERQIFVIGDSHARSYATLLNEVSTQLGLDKIHTYSRAGCPVASLYKPMAQACKKYLNQKLETIEKEGQPGDIVFLASMRLERLDKSIKFNTYDGVTAETRRLALAEASALIDRLESQQLQVLIEAPKPVFSSPPYRCADWFNQNNPVCATGLTVSRSFLQEHRRPTMEAIATLKRRHENLSVWDPFEVLCKEEPCSAFDGDKPLFFDGDHLSGHGNRVLRPSFINKLYELWQL
ncbi:MAG: acyltransferase family protein [Cyanobacteria bacterium P01_D01_bin.44]